MDGTRHHTGIWRNFLNNTRNMLRNSRQRRLSPSAINDAVDVSDIPELLEPINGTQADTPQVVSHLASPPAVIADTLHDDPEDEDIEMPRLEPIRDSDTGSIDSMPHLQSVSDSSEEPDSSEAEVERMYDMQPVADDQNSDWTDDDGDSRSEFRDMPPLEPIQSPGRRRARVEDDHDEDRDRRHPSERIGTGNPTGGPADQNPRRLPPQMPLPFRMGGRGLGLPPDDVQPNVMRFFEQIFAGAGAHPTGAPGQGQQGTAGNNPPNANQNRPNNRNVLGGVATFTWTAGDFEGGRAMPFPVPPVGFDPTLAGNGNGDNNNNPFNPFAEFLQNIDLAEVLGMREAPEDPERAKKLVEGLEVVPEGLVRRVERVGGAPGGHAEDNALGASGCAICWDKLLDSEGDGFADKKKEEEEEAQDAQVDTDVTMASSSDASSEPAPPSQPKIVCLPCAHVFHASCLIPWFSRPRQTTCPTCRFNVDPENLTYVRRMPNAGAEGTAATQPQATDAQTDGPQQPQTPQQTQVPQQPQTLPGLFQAAPPQQPPTQPGDQPPPPPHPQPQPTGAQPFGGVPMLMAIPPAIQQQMLASLNAVMQNAQQQPPVQNPDPGNNEPPDAHNHDNHTHGFVTIDINLSNLPFHPTHDDDGGNGDDIGDGNGNGNGDGNVNVNVHVDGDGNGNGNGNEMGDGPPAGMPQFMQQMFMGGMNAPPPPPHAGNPTGAAGTPNPDIFQGVFFGTPPSAPGSHSHPGRQREKKQWSLPPAPGPTLRQRVEEKEREAGLRCFDISCGVGPDDDDPLPLVSDTSMKQLLIRPLKGSTHVGTSVCSHSFHPACLVSAERVAGWGAEVNEQDVEVSCPVCRAVGCVTGEEWVEGVKALA